MFRMVPAIIKWLSIPMLLIASMFSRSAASYEPLVDFLICLGAMVFVQRAVQFKEYLLAAGFAAIAVVFSPLLLLLKIVVLTALTCVVTFVAFLAVFRIQTLPETL